jgi:hypothetical protein
MQAQRGQRRRRQAGGVAVGVADDEQIARHLDRAGLGGQQRAEREAVEGRSDLYALLRGCELGPDDPSAIDPARVAALTAADWGLHHTLELNLDRLTDGLSESPEVARTRIGEAIAAIAAAMEAAPKGRAWRLRARIGERKRWYEDPEEVART